MTALWTLPGYEVQALIGSGATGEVWRARESATGQPVALKRLRPGADPQALQREADVLRTLETPYVVRLREVVGTGEATVLVLDLATGGSLTALLARRGSLEPGEVVTVAAPVAQALAVAHDRGVVHGDVSPSNVLFTEAGMPLLSDLGAARTGDDVQATAEYLDPAVALGSARTGASDVWSLAAVCHHMLAGSPPHEGAGVGDVLGAARDGGRAPLGLLAPRAPRALVDVVEAALVRDPALRPDAAAFAAALRRAHVAEPVRFDGVPAAAPMPDVRETHAVPRHASTRGSAPEAPPPPARRLPRWLAPVAVGLVLLVGAASIGWWSGRGDDEQPVAVPAASPSAGSPSPSGSATQVVWPEVLDGLDAARAEAFATADPAALDAVYAPGSPTLAADRVLDGLDAARAEAFATADPAALDAVYAPGSPTLAADRVLVEQLAAAGQTAVGVRHEVRDVEVIEEDDDTARLLVVDVLAGYEVRDAAGAVVSSTPARGEAGYVVELTRTADGWRLVQVTAD